MRLKEKFYPESIFGGFSQVDGTIAFYLRINALITSDSVVVDYGCGRGALMDDPLLIRRNLRILKGKAQRVIGLDVDPGASSNPYLDEFHLLNSPGWPLAETSVDLIVTDSVLEHLVDPQSFFVEASRALRPGGYLCIRTPNKWGYPAIFSRLVPNREHVRVLEKVKDRTQAQDIFPTLYRCNTLPAIRSMLDKFSFDAVVFGYAPEPSYLSFSAVSYWLGVLHQRFAPGFLQPVIIAFAKKR